MDKRLEKLKKEIFDETDGNKFSDKIDKLKKKYSLTDRDTVLDILTEYSRNGQIHHWRNFLLTGIINLVEDAEYKYIDFFDWCITQPNLMYYGIDGLLKTKQEKSYPAIIHIANNDNIDIAIRAKAIKSIAVYSKQPFHQDLPNDPGYWKLEDLRLDELDDWQKNGYQHGEDHASPITHASLKNPKTPLEITVAKLDKLLEKSRKEKQDLSNPTDWLIVAKTSDIEYIEKKWNLPKNYLLFLKNYSPLDAFFELELIDEHEKYFSCLNLYGADNLIKRQDGYAFDTVKNEIIEDWPKNMVVIGDTDADPYCIDLSQIKEKDAPIYKSMHGAGKWEFELFAESFIDFLGEISVG